MIIGANSKCVTHYKLQLIFYLRSVNPLLEELKNTYKGIILIILNE